MTQEGNEVVAILGEDSESEPDEPEQPLNTTLINNKTTPQHTLKLFFIFYPVF
jgi:hypothetical protein